MYNQINNDVTTAMKAQDKFKLSVLRMLKSALQNEAISKKAELNDDEVEIVVKRQIKMRKDSLAEFEKFGKEEECKNLNQEINILLAYLPVQLTDEEIEIEVNKLFNEIKPDGIRDMGKCMKYASENIKNADMAKVSALIKQKLN